MTSINNNNNITNEKNDVVRKSRVSKKIRIHSNHLLAIQVEFFGFSGSFRFSILTVFESFVVAVFVAVFLAVGLTAQFT